MIAEFTALIKRVGPKLVVPAIIVLVGLSAFGLGRLSALQEGERGLVIYPAPEATPQP